MSEEFPKTLSNLASSHLSWHTVRAVVKRLDHREKLQFLAEEILRGLQAATIDRFPDEPLFVGEIDPGITCVKQDDGVETVNSVCTPGSFDCAEWGGNFSCYTKYNTCGSTKAPFVCKDKPNECDDIYEYDWKGTEDNTPGDFACGNDGGTDDKADTFRCDDPFNCDSVDDFSCTGGTKGTQFACGTGDGIDDFVLQPGELRRVSFLLTCRAVVIV